MKHFRKDCTASHITFGGLCVNCGAKPEARVETHRTPYNHREWEGGKARRTSFSGAWTRDGKYHDID